MKDDENRWRQFCTVYKVVDATRLSKFTKACADRKLYNCVRGTRTQPILCVGCSVHYWGPVQLIREVFSRLHSLSSSSTHNCLALIWGACLRFASHWRANSLGDSCVLGVHLSNVFWGLLFCLRKFYSVFVKRTYSRVCWRSTIDLCLMNPPKRSSFKTVLKVYTLSKILLWIPKAFIFFFRKYVLLLVHAANRVV